MLNTDASVARSSAINYTADKEDEEEKDPLLSISQIQQHHHAFFTDFIFVPVYFSHHVVFKSISKNDSKRWGKRCEKIGDGEEIRGLVGRYERDVGRG